MKITRQETYIIPVCDEEIQFGQKVRALLILEKKLRFQIIGLDFFERHHSECILSIIFSTEGKVNVLSQPWTSPMGHPWLSSRSGEIAKSLHGEKPRISFTWSTGYMHTIEMIPKSMILLNFLFVSYMYLVKVDIKQCLA